MSDKQVQISCKECGEVFSVFLDEMAEHNAKVVCPKCGKIHEHPDILERTLAISLHS